LTIDKPRFTFTGMAPVGKAAKTAIGKAADTAIKHAGSGTALAKKIKQVQGGKELTKQAISHWRKIGVPHTYVLTVEQITGLPRSYLRPDLYPPERERAA
jgi:hypothetical protein